MFVPCARADSTQDFSVSGNSGPWLWVNGGLNTGFQYGVGDEIGPTSVSAADGFSFAQGGTLTVSYLSGLVSAGSSFPFVNAMGDTFISPFDNNPGSSGKVAPSFYFNPSDYPAYLVELVGAFANSSGMIVGTPFNIGLGGSFVIPAGASQLQLGVNDDIYGDNSGAFEVSVSGPASHGAAPEPATLLLLCGGLAGLGVRLKGRVRV